MRRPTFLLAVAVVALVAYLAIARGPGASAADPAPHRIVYLFVSGKGPQAKAWYDGGPPQGAQVQSVLDTFARDGFHYAALASSGVASRVNVSSSSSAASNEPLAEAEYLLLLER